VAFVAKVAAFTGKPAAVKAAAVALRVNRASGLLGTEKVMAVTIARLRAISRA
jgi:hypothetical protein